MRTQSLTLFKSAVRSARYLSLGIDSQPPTPLLVLPSRFSYCRSLRRGLYPFFWDILIGKFLLFFHKCFIFFRAIFQSSIFPLYFFPINCVKFNVFDFSDLENFTNSDRTPAYIDTYLQALDFSERTLSDKNKPFYSPFTRACDRRPSRPPP